MMKQNKRVKDLEKIIKALDTAFHITGNDCINPLTGEVVLDNEYDAFKVELLKLSPDSKIFTSITAAKSKDIGKKVIHDPPMTSINKCNGTEAEKEKILYKFVEDAKKVIPAKEIPTTFDAFLAKFFSMSFKHDGLALSLEYENGILKRVGLRSKSGKDGIDVTEKTRHIKGIPQQLQMPLTCTIRGEVETTVDEFERQCEILGDNAKANPRAHTAGSMNQKTADKMKDRGLSFTAYNIVKLDDPPYTTEIERAKWASRVLKLNFVITTPLSIKKLELFENQHRRLNFKVDGAVISINNLEYQEAMGTSGDKDTGNPKGKLAWKFKDEVKATIVKDIIWQTGRTGNVTPVLIIDPVQLEGTTVSRCTAHNVGIIKKNKIGIGSKIEIIKSGKIIPKLHKVVDAKGSANIPTRCPSCGDGLLEDSGAHGALTLFCDSAECPSQGIKNLYHYLKTLGCKGIAESTIAKLMDAGFLTKRSDFYNLDQAEMLRNGFTERTVNLIDARIRMVPNPEQIKDNTKLRQTTAATRRDRKKLPIPMDKFIASFGMDGAGKEVGRILSKKYRDFDAIRNLTVDELETVDGIGYITAKSVNDFFKKNKKEVDELLKYVILEVPKGKSGKLNGKKFVLSGSMGMGKDYWRTEIENSGGEVKSSVSKKVNYLIAGPGSGAKSEKAEELGIPILEEDELEALLKE